MQNKSQELIKTPGFQLPDNLNSLTTNIIIRKAKAFVNSLDKIINSLKDYKIK